MILSLRHGLIVHQISLTISFGSMTYGYAVAILGNVRGSLIDGEAGQWLMSIRLSQSLLGMST